MIVLKADIPEAGYGKKVVLRNVSINVEQSTIVGIIGPNGAGKSTLLKVLMGIVKTAHGTVSMDGKVITNHSSEENVRNGISFVPQGNRVFTELTVKENLEMGGYLLKDKVEIEKRLSSVLELFLDLKDRIKQDAGRLSGGEKQQLALARALMLQPKILLLDEPSLGLSPKLVTKAFETIYNINQQWKTTILIVEQKVREVLKITHHVYALRMGEVVFAGAPQQLQDSEELKRIFLL
ncbi:MAG: ABC transporter ATP-binding protein [Ignavibacteriae bacterium]|nr:ABC transporter ATP-binding protein [Ignavibacteriota bacterium]